MQNLKRVFKFLFIAVCILVVLGFIGMACLTEYHVMTLESRLRPHREYYGRQGQLKVMFSDFYNRFSDLEENDSGDFGTNEFKNLFEIKKLLLENYAENDFIERKKFKYLYLNPNIDLWRQTVLCFAIGGKGFEGKNEIAVILCDPEGICNNKFPAVSFLSAPSSVKSVPVEWLESNAEAQKEWEAYERSLSEAGAK